MPILGAHMSIAGGYFRAVELAHAAGCDCVQLFTKNNNQWRAKPLTNEDVDKFQDALRRHRIRHTTAHTSYLINLASPDPVLWQKSVESFAEELVRAEALGIPGLVVHPGAYTTSSEQQGIERVISSLDLIHRNLPGLRVQTLLENTAGQGSCLGWRFEHLAAIIAGVEQPDRIGVCIDTCHTFAAGYPLGSKADYEATIAELGRVVGLKHIKAIHLNDSKTKFGSRVDRHAHIGRGCLGLEAFRYLLNDRRFAKVPMHIETAKEQENGEEMDVVNLRTLRSLVERRTGAASSRSTVTRGTD